MDKKKLFLEVGEKGRVTADVRVAVDPDSISWRCGTGAVLMNEAEQNTPFDMRVIGLQPGMAYVEFECVTAKGKKLADLVEVHVLPKPGEDEELVMKVRHFRKYHSGSAGVDLSAEKASLEASGEMGYVFHQILPATPTDTEIKNINGVQNADQVPENPDDSIEKEGAAGEGKEAAEKSSESASAEGEKDADKTEKTVSDPNGEGNTEKAPKEPETPKKDAEKTDVAPKAPAEPKAAPKAPKKTKEKKTAAK